MSPSDRFPARSRANNYEELFAQSREGNAEAARKLQAFLYGDVLQRLQTTYSQRKGSPTFRLQDFVNESVTQVISSVTLPLDDELHFYLMVAKTVKQMLVDQEKERQRQVGATSPPKAMVALNDTNFAAGVTIGLLDLVRMLAVLEPQAPEATQMFEICYFAGAPRKRVAELTKTPLKDVNNSIRFAKAWIIRQLKVNPGDIQ